MPDAQAAKDGFECWLRALTEIVARSDHAADANDLAHGACPRRMARVRTKWNRKKSLWGTTPELSRRVSGRLGRIVSLRLRRNLELWNTDTTAFQLERGFIRETTNHGAALNRPTPRGTSRKRRRIALLMPSHSPENQTPFGCANEPETPRLLKATAEANTGNKPPR